MTENIHRQRANPRREKTTRRAFILWMAAYTVALVLVAMLHSFGGGPGGVTIDSNGVATQQARATGAPQSSLADRLLPETVSLRVDG
ncbi:hypothetical protein SAMN02745157_1810 [Kaistia soli DSM 19436]|uniref:Uncharacterized protein n=1 Tax=Kaistia soli DSM 19436 TaxID=1122133 RepID=A0A1M4ZGA2_9HYPH|nr:hypothetical protein [Kaistia soli]SHF17069.1 hypothetical protein SAMN02745157_1810 [Kaistia soli DSM 19436]